MRSRSVGSVVLSALIVLGAVAPATASATFVDFPRLIYVAPVGEPFPDPISVTVRDDAGNRVAGVEVAFSVTPDVDGATAAISAPVATTDATGVAQITATAGIQAGVPRVHASVDGASAFAVLVNRPPGHVPGEQLASIVAQNQDSVTEDVRDGLGGGTFLLVDVCGAWCQPCATFARDVETAITQLAAVHGVKLKLTTLLQQGLNAIQSKQSDAQFWKETNGLTGSVLHAGGSIQSELYRGAGFFLFDNDPRMTGVYPTHMLVDPKGNILDRRVGTETSEQTVERVLAYATKEEKKVKPPKDED